MEKSSAEKYLVEKSIIKKCIVKKFIVQKSVIEIWDKTSRIQDFAWYFDMRNLLPRKLIAIFLIYMFFNFFQISQDKFLDNIFHDDKFLDDRFLDDGCLYGRFSKNVDIRNMAINFLDKRFLMSKYQGKSWILDVLFQSTHRSKIGTWDLSFFKSFDWSIHISHTQFESWKIKLTSRNLMQPAAVIYSRSGRILSHFSPTRSINFFRRN